MICGHCGKGVHESVICQNLGKYALELHRIGDPDEVSHGIEYMKCPECCQLIVFLGLLKVHDNRAYLTEDRILVYPRKKTSRNRPSRDVPEVFANDFYEACLVLNDSPKASAALSRRCLQNVIHDKVGIKKKNLDMEIDDWINAGGMPTSLVEALHTVRAIGNFAAHPLKIQNTGEIVEVEPGEAEWSLDTLELVFDHCFVRPAVLQRRKDALKSSLRRQESHWYNPLLLAHVAKDG